MKILIVLSGCPAAGKSGFIRKVTELIQCDTVQIDNFLMPVQNFTQETYHWARQQLLVGTEDFIINGRNQYVLVEDTNHLRSLVKPFRRLAKKYQIQFLHIVFQVSLEQALERNQKREQFVDPSVINKIYEQINLENFFSDTFFFSFNEETPGKELCGLFSNAVVLQENYSKKVEMVNYGHLLDCELRKVINSLVREYFGNKSLYSSALTLEKKRLTKLFPTTPANYSETLERFSNFLKSLHIPS